MKIILLGYMGSGKSSIGNKLSKSVNVPFFDLDYYIEKKEGLSISKIFKQKGEIYFRKKESKYLNLFLKEHTHYILSLGGGTPCYGKNMENICKENATSIYLKASIKTLVHRLSIQKANRILIPKLNKSKLEEFVAKHLFERSFFYQQAKISLIVDYKSISDISEEIKNLTHLTL